MYLSRLLLNPRSKQVYREQRDPYQQHRTVMQAFPETLPDDERVLYRLDTNADSGQLLLLVQSHGQPNWNHLTEGDYLSPPDPFAQLDNPAVKAFTLNFQAGQVFKFRLRANPTKRLFKDDPERKLKKGQRIGLFDEMAQVAWLQKRAAKNGFAIHNVYVVDEGFQTSYSKKEHQLKFLAARFEGYLQVTDPDRFLKAVQTGIGPAKAFGCGLLSVAPAGR